jgi:hypothetical protein
VDGGAGVDPDAAARTAMQPGGNTGDAVGSVQGMDTKVSLTDPDHQHQEQTFSNGPGANNVVANTPNINTTTGGTTTSAVPMTALASTGITLVVPGLNHETRPVNFYANAIIKY